MSLIEEALRRIQEAGQPSERTETPTSALKTRYAGAPAGKRSSARWVRGGLILCGIGVVVGLGLNLLTHTSLPKSITPPVVRQQPVSVPPKSAFPSRTLQNPRSHLLELNGVVRGAGEPLAIVNGNILRVGETMGGVTLLEVGDGSARVRWQDREMTLATSQ